MNQTIEQFVDALSRERGSRHADGEALQEDRDGLLERVRAFVFTELAAMLPEECSDEYRELLGVDPEPESIREYFIANIPEYHEALAATLTRFRHTFLAEIADHVTPVQQRANDRHDHGVEAIARYARRKGEWIELAGNDGVFKRWIVADAVHGTADHDVIFHDAHGAVLRLSAKEAERREAEACAHGHGNVVHLNALPPARVDHEVLRHQLKNLMHALETTPNEDVVRQKKIQTKLSALQLQALHAE